MIGVIGGIVGIRWIGGIGGIGGVRWIGRICWISGVRSIGAALVIAIRVPGVSLRLLGRGFTVLAAALCSRAGLVAFTGLAAFVAGVLVAFAAGVLAALGAVSANVGCSAVAAGCCAEAKGDG